MTRSRSRSIAALSLALAIAQLSCGREVTGPGNGFAGRVANIALDPQMPQIDSVFNDALGISTVVPFDRVRVTALTQDQSVAYDRTIPFPSTVDSIALNIAIPLGDSSTEGVGVALRIAYINAQGDTIFRGGPITAFATAGTGSGSGQVVNMPIRYTGVGSNATSVVLTPDTGTVLVGSTTLFTAQARDTSGAIAGTPLLFYSPDTARVLIANPAIGSVQWKPSRGLARVIALHPGGLLADTSFMTVSLPFSKLVALSGSGQSGLAGTTLAQPVVVRTLASDNVPVPGVVVTFAVASGGGTLSTLTDTSDANGAVSTSWTLGAPIGTQSITASAAGAPPLTIGAQSNAGPTAITLNITSPIGASRYYAVVDGATLPAEIVGKIDAAYARTTTLTVPVPAGTGYTVYVMAADSLSALPDTLPTISAGMRLSNVNVPAGNTVTIPVLLQNVTLVGTVPSNINAGDAFTADVTLTDPAGLFYDFFTSINLYRSDTIVNTDRGGSGVGVTGMQVLSATQKRFTSSPFRATAAGVIYSQYGGGIATGDRKYIFYVVSPSRQRNENLFVTNVAASAVGIRVNLTSPTPVTRFVVAIDTGSGPIAWGGTTGTNLTSANIEIPVPAGSNYRIRVAAVNDFGFNAQLFATLSSLRAGNVLTGQSASAIGFTDVPMTLVAETNAVTFPSPVASGVGATFTGTMRDPSLFNATAPCLMRYSTAGPISTSNLGVLLTTGCTISNRLANGTFSVAGALPGVTGPTSLHSQVFTSVIGYTPSGSRVEMLHMAINVTTISQP